MMLTKPVKKELGSALKAFSGIGAGQGVHVRCAWLNANVLGPGAIDDAAMAVLSVLPLNRAMELLKDLEAKGPQVGNPSNYILSAVRRELAGSSGGGGGGSGETSNWGGGASGVPPLVFKTGSSGVAPVWNTDVHKRCTWINSNVFGQEAINQDAIAVLSGLSRDRAMELLHQVEAKAAELKNPSGYLIQAAKWDITGQFAGGVVAAPVQEKCTWLNENVFGPGAISQDTIAALSCLPLERAMELLQQAEDKKDEVKNPSGFLIVAAKKSIMRSDVGGSGKGKGGGAGGGAIGRWSASGGGVGAWPNASASGGGVGAWSNASALGNVSSALGGNATGVYKRCAWLNANGFGHAPINQDAMEVLSTLSWERAKELLNQAEAKSAELTNPSGYLIQAAKWDVSGLAGSVGGPVATGVQKRCEWMNANLFAPGAISQDAMAALSCLSWGRAMELLNQAEEKKDQMINPSGFLIVACKRDLSRHMNAKGGGGKGDKGKGWSGSDGVDAGVHKRCTWLNANIFGKGAINKEAIVALSSLSWERSMELLKQVEENKLEISDPSGVLLAAVAGFGTAGWKSPGEAPSFFPSTSSQS